MISNKVYKTVLYISDEYEGLAPSNIVLIELKERYGITPDTTKEIIEKLKNKEVINEPKPGYYCISGCFEKNLGELCFWFDEGKCDYPYPDRRFEKRGRCGRLLLPCKRNSQKD